MHVSIQQFAQKIEKHLHEMKLLQEGAPQLREHAVAIQTLCDLMLEASPGATEKKTMIPMQPIQAPAGFSTGNKPLSHDDDDSNGDSIFDF